MELGESTFMGWAVGQLETAGGWGVEMFLAGGDEVFLDIID